MIPFNNFLDLFTNSHDILDMNVGPLQFWNLHTQKHSTQQMLDLLLDKTDKNSDTTIHIQTNNIIPVILCFPFCQGFPALLSMTLFQPIFRCKLIAIWRS